jgi:DNA-dependent RNA polymerase auxiliary subunit epsilon
MGAKTVGTTVSKFHCQCMMESGEELFITVKATSEAQASEKVHEGYNVEYVLDILSPLQLEYRKRHLRRGITAGTARIS